MKPRAALILALLLLGSHARAEGPWTLEHEGALGDGAVSIWSRPVAGSDFPEYRMRLRIAAAPEEVLGALESNFLDSRTWPESFRRRVLRKEPGLLLSYDYIEVPLFSDRDVVLRTETTRDAESGVLRVTWRAVEGEGPPPREGVVRMPRSEGSWRVEGDGHGGSRVVYRSFVEFDGYLPRSFVSSNLRTSILEQAHWLRRAVRERHLADRR